MATAYSVPIATPLNAHLVAYVTVMRQDGDALSPEDLAAAEALYPPPHDQAAQLSGRTKPAKPKGKTATKPRAKPGATATKPRKAAKRPTRSRAELP